MVSAWIVPEHQVAWIAKDGGSFCRQNKAETPLIDFGGFDRARSLLG